MKRIQNLQTQTEMKSNNNPASARTTYLQKINLQLREQNSQLARELDEHKAIIRDLRKARDDANQELIGEKAFTRKIMECVKDIQLSAQINLTNLVSSSNCVTDILKMTHTLDTFNKKDRRSIHMTPTENIAIISSDVLLKPNVSNPNLINEVNKINTSRFTSLNPLSYLLNLDTNNADDELRVPKNFQLAEFYKENQQIEPDGCGEQECGKEVEYNNRLDTITEESPSICANIIKPFGGLLPKVMLGTNLNPQEIFEGNSGLNSKLERTICRESKSQRAETSIQRRSNSLSEEDQIELIDDSEIITPRVPLLSSTIISSSPKEVPEFRITRSFENRRKSSNIPSEAKDSEPCISQTSLASSKTTVSDSLRLDSSNPTISKLEALMSYNLISVVNKNSSTTPVPKKVSTKSKVKKANYRKRPSELDKITNGFSNPRILHAIALRSYKKTRELRSRNSPKMGKRKFKQIWSDTHTPKLLRPKTGSLKEPNLRNKLRR